MLDENRSFKDHHLCLTTGDPDEHLLAATLDRDDELVVDGAPGTGPGCTEAIAVLRGFLAPVALAAALFLLSLLLLWCLTRLNTSDLDLVALYANSFVLLDNSL
jgi:hypothetical protein